MSPPESSSFSTKFSFFLTRAWYKKSKWLILLLPFSWVFSLLANYRRKQYESGNKLVWKSSVPIIVVGNISVGGTGKTPLVIQITKKLLQAGYKPAIVSRGYGATQAQYPQWVTATTAVNKSGDEALLIARSTSVPVVIDPDRPKAIQALMESNDCDIIISDDGLQHYAMGRDIELAVIDGERGLGNEYLLPAGPLREKPTRLRTVNMVVLTGKADGALLSSLRQHNNHLFTQTLDSTELVSLSNGETCSLSAVNSGQAVHAVAGIGNPMRFFDSLQQSGFDVIPHAFPDHHDYREEDLDFGDDLEIIMTEKDAVKCQHFELDKAWYLRVESMLDEDFIKQLMNNVDKIKSAKH